MLFTKGLCGVRIYYDGELIGESEPCFANESMPIKIPQNDMNIEVDITTRYEVRQDAIDGKHYLFADGVRVCEVEVK